MTATAPPRILAIFTCSGGPSAAPFPNLPPGQGHKLLLRAFAQALAARELFTRLVVATGDLEVAQLAISQGLQVPLRLPPELCQPGTPIVPILRHTLDYLERLDGAPYDWICWLQPVPPLTTPADFAAGITLAQHGTTDSVAAVVPAPDAGQPGPDGRPRPAHVQNHAFTLVRREVLREQNSLWGAKVLAAVMPAERSRMIQTAADFEELERLSPAPAPPPANPGSAAIPGAPKAVPPAAYPGFAPSQTSRPPAPAPSLRSRGPARRTAGGLPAALSSLTRRGDALSISLSPYFIAPSLALFFLELLMLALPAVIYSAEGASIFPLLTLLFGVAFGGGRWLVKQHRGPYGPLGRIWSAGPRMVGRGPFFLGMVLVFLTAAFTDPLIRHVLWQYVPAALLGPLARVIVDTPVGISSWLVLLLMVHLTYSQVRRGVAQIASQTPGG